MDTTGNLITAMKEGNSTSPDLKKDTITTDNVIIKISDMSRSFLVKPSFSIENCETFKVELTQEEEDRFYKKAFKTSLN